MILSASSRLLRCDIDRLRELGNPVAAKSGLPLPDDGEALPVATSWARILTMLTRKAGQAGGWSSCKA